MRLLYQCAGQSTVGKNQLPRVGLWQKKPYTYFLLISETSSVVLFVEILTNLATLAPLTSKKLKARVLEDASKMLHDSFLLLSAAIMLHSTIFLLPGE